MTEYSNFYFDDSYADALESPVFTYIDNNSSSKNKFVSGEMASPNFDGFIPKTTSSVSVRDIKAGYEILIETASSTQLYPIVRVDPSDVSIGEPDQCDVFYLTPDGLQQITYAPTTTSAVVRYEDWDNKFLNGSGWIITQQGNAIFSNVAIRGRVEANSGYIGNNTSGWEIGSDLLSNASVGFYAPSAVSGQIAIFAGSSFANRATAPFRVGYDGSMVSSNASITGNLTATTLDVGGANGIIYNGSAVTIGASVTINAPVTVNSLQVGASPTLLRIADNVSGTNDGIYVNSNNYWYSDGQFSVGGSANNAVWSGSTLTITGTINATNITSSVGNIAGFTLSNNQLSTASIIVSSSGGLRLGNPTVFSVDQFGNLIATSASITGNITANSGQFTGSVSAQHITASTGNVGGWNLSASFISGNSASLDATGAIRLGSGQNVVALSSTDTNRIWAGSAVSTTAPFKVSSTGLLTATGASITGNINAESGRFTGSISAQHITASTGTVAGFTLANNQMSTASVVVSSSGGFRLGNPTIFSVDQYGNLVAQNASITGNINATSGSFSGDITAAAGRFTGSVAINAGGLLIAGAGQAQNVSIDSTGLYGYTQFGTLAFSIPTTASQDPIIGRFKILETGLVADTSAYGANLIVGNVIGSGSAASVQNGMVIRGYRSLNASVAMYTVQSGSATTYNTGNGIYFDETGKFKIKGATGSLAFDGSDLYISGNVNARSGQFTGSISAQHITASIGNIGGFILSASSITDSVAASSVGMTTGATAFFAGGDNATGGNAKFFVTSTGSVFAQAASITGDIRATSGQFTGSISAQHITASTGSVGGWGLSASTLSGNNVSLNSASGSLVLGSGQNIAALSSTDTNRIWAGSAVSTTAPFKVSSTGFLTANGASITGNIDAQSGVISGNLVVTGKFYAASAIATAGQRVEIDKTGVIGYNQIGERSFYLATGSASLLSDGGFEQQGAVSASLGGIWSTFWGNGSVVVEGTTLFGGSKAARIAPRAGNSDLLQALNTSIGVSPGTTYSISGYVYSGSAVTTGSTGYVEIWVLESSDPNYPSYFDPKAALKVVTPATSVPARTWTKIGGTYTAASPYAVLSIRSYASSVSYTPFFIWDSIDFSTGSANTSQISGFSFNDKVMSSEYLTISSLGQAIFGIPTLSASTSSAGSVVVSSATVDTSNFLTLTGTDPTYRMWVGNSNPTKAFFSVQKNGTVNVAQGGDIVLTSSAAGTTDLSISRIEFWKENAASAGSTLRFEPSASTFYVGSQYDSDMRILNLSAGTTGSVQISAANLRLTGSISGTLLFSASGSLRLGTLDSTATTRVPGHLLGGQGADAIFRTSSSVQNEPVLYLHKFNDVGGSLTASQSMINFILNGTTRGRLFAFTTGANPALFGTSDRRLKTEIEPFQDASGLIKQLNLYSFKWTESGLPENGFLADELQQVIPSAVIGDPNAVDENGDPVYQQVAETKIVCYLAGALKEALIKIDELEERLQLLEGG